MNRNKPMTKGDLVVAQQLYSEFYHGQEKKVFGEVVQSDFNRLKKAVADIAICRGEVDQIHYVNDKPYAIVYFAGYQGMIPADQLEFRELENINGFVGRPIDFVIKGYEEDTARSKENAERGNDEKVYIFAASRTEALDMKRAMTMSLDSFQVGVMWPGTVLSVERGGALMDLGGVRAWLPIGEVSHEYIPDLSKVLQKGDFFDVKITDLDKEDTSNNARVQVSIKALLPAPWEAITKEFHLGDVKKGTVVGRLADTGYFIELKSGVTGLADRVVNGKVYDLAIGDTVRAAIAKIDPEQRRIRLRIKSVIRPL